jgi:hypothetical protein
MTPAQLRTRMLGTLVPARFASSGVYDCPLCGGRQDLHVATYDNKPSTYLFNLAVFCNCEPQKVADEMARRARRRRRLHREVFHMPGSSQFDELKLQVSLVDNATAQLKSIKQSLDELGTGSQMVLSV